MRLVIIIYMAFVLGVGLAAYHNSITEEPDPVSDNRGSGCFTDGQIPR